MFFVNKYIENLIIHHLLEVVLCSADRELDGCINTVRVESNPGNSIAHIILEGAYADVAVTTSHHLKHFWKSKIFSIYSEYLTLEMYPNYLVWSSSSKISEQEQIRKSWICNTKGRIKI